MSFHKKIVLALILSSLLPLVIMLWHFQRQSKTLLIEKSLNSLEAIAEEKKLKITTLIRIYGEHVKLVTSRTQLRKSLQAYHATQNPQDLRRIRNILQDAIDATSEIVGLHIFTLDGQKLISVVRDGAVPHEAHIAVQAPETTPNLVDIYRADHRTLLVFQQDLWLANEPLGHLQAEIQSEALTAMFEDYTGLGMTGEILLVKRNEAGNATFLHQVRFERDKPQDTTVLHSAMPVASILAVSGREGRFSINHGLIDYRGTPIVAVTRYLPPLKLGIVAKMSSRELTEKMDDITNKYVTLIVFLGGLNILCGVLLGRSLVRPIFQLTEAAQAIAAGDLTKRVDIRSTNELGQLAHAFNDMTFALSQTMVSKEALQHEVVTRRQTQAQLFEKNQFLQAIIDNASALIYMKDIDGRYLLVNRRFRELFGVSEEIYGTTDREIFPPDVAEAFQYNDRQVLASGQSLESEEIVPHKDGPRTSISMKFSLRDAEGNIYAVGGVSTDITERVRLEQELQAAKIKAEDASQAKALFLATMSHEIRTPLNGCIGAMDLLSHTELNSHQRRHVDIAMISGRNLLALINDILDFSKVEAGHLELERMEYDLRITIEEVFEGMATKAHEKDLVFGSHVEADVPKRVLGDTQRLQQIVRNLLSNAIKFTDRGFVKLEVGMRGATTLHYRVEDSGIGLSEAQQDRLFAPFSQAEAATTRQYGGTGLGLAISKHLVEAMGGEMGVESCEGQGSTFWFSLPLDTSQATQSDEKTVALTTATLRVLIVDAQELHADLLAKQLRSWGMGEARAASSAQALEALEQALASGEPFQAVIVDWQLPQGEARSLAQAIHERRDLEDSAVVLMFNVGSNIDEADFEPIGIAGILTKPVRQSTLYNEIINAIAHKKNFSFTKPPSPDDQAIERSQWLQGKRVLLAEDNEINRIVASDMLQMLGCHCDLAWNGGEAVALTTTTVFDLILMDCQMPEMDGFEATQVIRENEKEEGGRRVPIIALTANAIEGDRQRCIEAGMDDYIAKPVDFDKLVETMTRVFSGHAEPSPVSPPLATVADQAHPIHVAEMLRLCRNNHRLVRTLLERFREQAETDLETLRNLVPAGDAQRVFEVAHGLKGAARMLSAERVAEAAQQLEQMGRAETLDHASEQLHMLEREIERCLAYLPEAIQHIS